MYRSRPWNSKIGFGMMWVLLCGWVTGCGLPTIDQASLKNKNAKSAKKQPGKLLSLPTQQGKEMLKTPIKRLLEASLKAPQQKKLTYLPQRGLQLLKPKVGSCVESRRVELSGLTRGVPRDISRNPANEREYAIVTKGHVYLVELNDGQKGVSSKHVKKSFPIPPPMQKDGSSWKDVQLIWSRVGWIALFSERWVLAWEIKSGRLLLEKAFTEVKDVQFARESHGLYFIAGGDFYLWDSQRGLRKQGGFSGGKVFGYFQNPKCGNLTVFGGNTKKGEFISSNSGKVIPMPKPMRADMRFATTPYGRKLIAMPYTKQGTRSDWENKKGKEGPNTLFIWDFHRNKLTTVKYASPYNGVITRISFVGEQYMLVESSRGKFPGTEIWDLHAKKILFTMGSDDGLIYHLRSLPHRTMIYGFSEGGLWSLDLSKKELEILQGRWNPGHSSSEGRPALLQSRTSSARQPGQQKSDLRILGFRGESAWPSDRLIALNDRAGAWSAQFWSCKK